MLVITTSPTYRRERKYICRLVFEYFWGLEYTLEYKRQSHVSIRGDDGQTLIVADIFFQTPTVHWLQPESLPCQPLEKIPVSCDEKGLAPWATDLPILFGRSLLMFNDPGELALDVFGSSFFLISRYEEYVHQEKDRHLRFPAEASIAFQNGFIDRPLVNEYLEILWMHMKRLWPGLKRKQRSFRCLPTHDVDIPFAYLGRPFRKILLQSAVDVYHGHEFRQILENFSQWRRVNRTEGDDPFDTFDWIMQIAEEEGINACFNFMSGGRLPIDYYYPIEGFHIQKLIRKIIQRGHEIGFHPSYQTALDGGRWKSEFERFSTAISGCRVRGGRQHFLRFNAPATWRYWADNGLEYDSTLGFADHAGFRCSTCYEYPVYDLENRQELNLRERPLIAMDTSVIDDNYMGMGLTEVAVDYLLELKRRCRYYKGDFVLLWHNQRFVDPREKEIYRTVIG
jgi:hypothetical protein